MVGIPGRSRGCATCRKRHIRCDLLQPACGNCSRSGKVCLGYERFPTFINRTSTGIQRRRHLEEVKSVPTGLDQYHVTATKANDLANHHNASIASWQGSHTHDFLQWFHESLLVTPSSMKALYMMDPIMQLSSHGQMLSTALLAVSTARFGVVTNSQDFTRYGQQLYTRCLGLLRQALENVRTSKGDETLACAAVLTLYELLNAECVRTNSKWLKHLDGIGQLLIHRGPAMCSGSVARAVLEHCREAMMIQNLMRRKRSEFGETEWLSKPWINSEKSLQQKICDFGLRLSNLMHDYDSLLIIDQYTEYDLDWMRNQVTLLYQDMYAESSRKSMEPESAQSAFLGGLRLACANLSTVLHSDLQSQKQADREVQSQSPDITTHVPNLRNVHLSIPFDEERERTTLVKDIISASTACANQDLDPGTIVRVMWALRTIQEYSHAVDSIYMQYYQLVKYFDSVKLSIATTKLQYDIVYN